ncbi:MAG: cytochrome c3 family protein [Planctomycetota bacterium]
MVVTITIVAGLSVLPLWLFRRSGVREVALAVLLSAAAMVAAIASTMVGSPVPSLPTQRPIEVHEPAYVGSAACRACHPAEHASWFGSFHRTMTQVASHATLVPEFERLELDCFGKPVVLEWRGDTLWAKFERGGRRPAAVERPVEQLTGSHHLQVLWYSTGLGRELAPVPMAFKLEERIWLPLTSVFVLPPEFRDPPEPGAWSQSCSMCHATATRPRIDIDQNDTHVAEFGISCEACHGPGAAHQAANQNPLRRYIQRFEGRDATIVNPGTLPPARSAEVCGHCHSVSILREQHFEAWRERGSPFVPGQDLQTTHLVIGTLDRDAPELRRELAKNPNFFSSSFWSDGQVRLSGREFSGLRRSPCYTHGDVKRQMDCTSCHTMHTADGSSPAAWCDDQLGEGKRGNSACTQCHSEYAQPAALALHSHHAPESSGSRCYDCHMSHTSVGLLKASRNHAITNPSVRSELETGRPNACNQCHLDRTLAWTAEQLATKWGIESPALDDEQRTVAASVRWLLTGDAGQRLLAAWSFGWSEAQAASGTDWMAPYLARLLDDPYYAVRFNAQRSLRSLPGEHASLIGYDFLAAAEPARVFGERVQAEWALGYRGPARPALLLDKSGLQAAAFQRLYARRDNRPVYLAE